MHVFPVLIYRSADSQYRTEVPDLPACQETSANLPAALEGTRNAIYVQLEALLRQGRIPPKPSDLIEVHELWEQSGAIALTAVEIDMNRVSTAVERVNVTLPNWLISRIDAMSTNRSRFLADSAIKMLQSLSEQNVTPVKPTRRVSSRVHSEIQQGAVIQRFPKSSRFGWFDSLTDEVVRAMQDKMHRRKLPKGSFLFRSGQWDGTLFYILKGTIQLKTTSHNGKESLFSVHRAGSCIGVTTAMQPLEHVYDAVATSQLTVDCLPQDSFQELRQKYAEIDRAIAEWSAHRIWELMRVIFADSALALPGRLASHIDYLLEPENNRQQPEARNELRISQEMLAASVGASRQAVGKVMRDWKAAGIVDISYGRVNVLDREALVLMFDQ